MSAKNWNCELDTKTVDLRQSGNEITGHAERTSAK